MDELPDDGLRSASRRSGTNHFDTTGGSPNDVGADDLPLLWVAATNFFAPDAEPGWRRVDRNAPSGAEFRDAVSAHGKYAVVFEASFDSRLRYDPVVEARTIRAAVGHVPEVVVAVVAPMLEVPVATQHALAHEVGLALDVADVRVVTISDRWSSAADSKARKAIAETRPEAVESELDGIGQALDVVAGRAAGEKVDAAAAAFVHAYLSRGQRRIPFRFTPLQRRILEVLARGSIVPTTSGIAKTVYSTEKKVSEGIAEMVAQFVPGQLAEAGVRDGHQRLYWLMYRYGAWIRIVNDRDERTRGAETGS